MTAKILALIGLTISGITGIVATRDRSQAFDDHWRSVRETLRGTAINYVPKERRRA